MSTSHRICETCVYCSFAGNCDRYNKPLTSIEQPACDAYEIHPLLDKNDKLKAENAKLRELTKEMFYSLLNVAGGRRIMTAGEAQNLMGRMSALGVEVNG